MTDHGHNENAGAPGRRFLRETSGFSRVLNLSDAVFAIALTLLVLTLDTPAVPPAQLGAALTDQGTQFIAFALSFALVANLWWQHHTFVELLGFFEAGLISINLALLGAVVLVPFPTSLIGHAPAERAAVLPFIGLFAGIAGLNILLLWRAHSVGAWRRPLALRYFFWLLSRNIAGLIVLLVAFGLALAWPAVGLIVVAVSIVLGPLASRLSYRGS